MLAYGFSGTWISFLGSGAYGLGNLEFLIFSYQALDERGFLTIKRTAYSFSGGRCCGCGGCRCLGRLCPPGVVPTPRTVQAGFRGRCCLI